MPQTGALTVKVFSVSAVKALITQLQLLGILTITGSLETPGGENGHMRLAMGNTCGVQDYVRTTRV